MGENGCGKSTLLEAIAECCGFNPEGGKRDHQYATTAERSSLAQTLRLSWSPKVTNFATYIEQVSTMTAYGGKSLHKQSHGESFLALFANRFEQGIYILDEPEAALSPQRQLSFMRILCELEKPNHAQFLISTHSPILLSYPGATLFSLDGDGIRKTRAEDTPPGGKGAVRTITDDSIDIKLTPQGATNSTFTLSTKTAPDQAALALSSSPIAVNPGATG